MFCSSIAYFRSVFVSGTEPLPPFIHEQASGRGVPPVLRPLPRKIIDLGHGLFPLYPLILKIVLTSSSSLSSQVISMGQRKDFGMSFCQGGIQILSSQTPSYLRESLADTNATLKAADNEVAGLRDHLVEADRRVAG
jgi:hypothetical protein